MAKVSYIWDKSKTITIYAIITIISLAILFNIFLMIMEYMHESGITSLSPKSVEINEQSNKTNNKNINPLQMYHRLKHYLSNSNTSQSQLNLYSLSQINPTSSIHQANLTNVIHYKNGTLPLSHIPKQNLIPLDEILNLEKQRTKCKFKGKLFILGVSKTGTSSMKEIYRRFGYTCIRNPMITCGYQPLYFYMSDSFTPLFVAPDDISWLFHSKPLYNDFLQSIKIATAFSDAPWAFLYPLYDQLIPSNHSKFILTIRDSTRDIANSNMKMFVRNYIKRLKLDPNKQYDYTNFSETNPRRLGIHMTWEQFWMLTARQYELHNKNVIEYFAKRGRLNDLLVVNLATESRKMPYSEQWYRITNFLGCGNVTNKPLPWKNVAVQQKHDQIEFFPKDYVFEWEDFKWPDGIDRIFKLVNSMNGKYNEEKWNILRRSYGQIFSTKHRL